MMPSLKMCKPQKQMQQNNTVTPVSPSECTRALKYNSLMVRFTSQGDSTHLNEWVASDQPPTDTNPCPILTPNPCFAPPQSSGWNRPYEIEQSLKSLINHQLTSTLLLLTFLTSGYKMNSRILLVCVFQLCLSRLSRPQVQNKSHLCVLVHGSSDSPRLFMSVLGVAASFSMSPW